jgi:type II secretory pathway component PulK
MRKRKERGVAMMLALITMVLIGVLTAELIYETQVYSGIVFRQRDQLRSQLLARSGVRLALLQVRAAAKAKEQAKNLGLGESDSLTDKIWQTPMILPPPAPPGLGAGIVSTLDAFRKSLGLEGQVAVTIQPESGRLSLNQLVWLNATMGAGTQSPQGAGGSPTPVPNQSQISPEKRKEMLDAQRKTFADILDQLLFNKRLEDEGFRDRHPSVTGQTLIGNILAWISPEERNDGENREKMDYYRSVEPKPYAPREAPMVSESELQMVRGFDDELVALVAGQFSVQQSAGVNVNEASRELLQALIPSLSKDEAERVIKRRNDESAGGPFKSEEEFWTFMGTINNFDEPKKQLQERGIKLLAKEQSFQAVITAESGVSKRTWIARLGPLPPKPPTNTEGGPASPNPAPAPSPTVDGPAEEVAKEAEKNKSTAGSTSLLHVIYLRSD